MPDFLLDTQTIRYWFDDSSPFHETVRKTAAALPPGSHVCISVITLGEIEYGIAFNPVGMGGRLDEYRRFVRDKLPRIVPISRHTSEPYGRARALLTERFPPPGGWSKKRRAEQMYDPLAAGEFGFDENDLWLVAQAIERNLVLVSNDKMTRIRDVLQEIEPGVSIENWSIAEAADS